MYMPAQDLTIAESNRLSKFDEYIVTFNKKNALSHVEIYVCSWILIMIGFTWLVTSSWILEGKNRTIVKKCSGR